MQSCDDTAPEPTPAELLAVRPLLSMHAMDGLLLDDVPLNRIADAIGTPTWVYSAATIRDRYRALACALKDAGLDAHPHYAVKANDHLAVLSLLAGEGGAPTWSAKESFARPDSPVSPRATSCFPGSASRSASCASPWRRTSARSMSKAPRSFRCSPPWPYRWVASRRVALRVNPDVDAGTHAKISTGRAEDKFGIPYDDAASLYAHGDTLPGIRMLGLATHIGSQILDLGPYRTAYQRIADLVRDLRAPGAAGRAG